MLDEWYSLAGCRDSHVCTVNTYQTSPGVSVDSWASMSDQIKMATRTSGVWFEPVYSGRLVLLASRLLAEDKLANARTCIFHSGGTLALLQYLEWEHYQLGS